MKKRLIKFLTLILSVIIGAASLFGCNIVTDNTERDLNQVVATVNVNQQENIYKKDIVMVYMQYYGSSYAQYYDEATTYSILNSLINNRIMVQVAYEEFEKTSVVDDTKEKYTPERYLSLDEITDAQYDTYKFINGLLDAYSEDKSNTEKKDTLIFDLRTVPTDATNKEKELTTNEKKDYIAKGFDITSTEYRRASFNKIISLLKENGLLGNDYNGSIETTDYFARVLKSNYENEIIEKYENAIKQKFIDELSYETLEKSYIDKLNDQKAWDNEKFVSALSSATATSPILYSAFGTYGYVYNLLLGVNDYQSKKIEELQHKKEHEHLTEAQYSADRKDILAGTVAKDLRASWILSGYDFDFATKKFTGDYTFAKNADNSLEFQGEVTKLRDADDEKNLSAVYRVDSVKTFGLEEFTKSVNKYVYNDESAIVPSAHQDRYYEYDLADKPDAEYDAKMNELLFAFSTDPGSLNTYKGYVIKPDNNEYVKTFGDAGKELLEYAATHAGKSGSYKVVASDYGYHFMFFSEVWTEYKEYADLNAYLDTLDIDKGGAATWEDYFKAQKADKEKWEKFEEENNFLYFLANEWVSVRFNDKTTRTTKNVTTEYRYGEHKDSTVIYKDRFSDLLG